MYLYSFTASKESVRRMIYEIAICDDDTVFLSSFRQMLEEALRARGAAYKLTFFNDPSALMQEMDRGKKFDLLFLDIYYDKEKGIQFAKALREKNDQTDVVFMTALTSYAVESYDAAPLHYLLKPINPEKLDAALTRFLEKNSPQKLHFMTTKGHLCAAVSDIVFIEIYGHEIIIHLVNGMKETCMGTLKGLEPLLPELTFVHPHRSYLVNLGHISEITRYQIRLSSNDLIPVSKNLYNSTLSSFINYANQSSITF